jgi:hypothetical protein
MFFGPAALLASAPLMIWASEYVVVCVFILFLNIF